MTAREWPVACLTRAGRCSSSADAEIDCDIWEPELSAGEALTHQRSTTRAAAAAAAADATLPSPRGPAYSGDPPALHPDFPEV